ncbi:MAG TPA: nucleotidyltransferase family protein [Candidatus Bathyarchaeia archaeon]|nr:nucleotidyltransferase family protein [Candidatus Bathyarchaeia archaeon]
MQTLAQEDTKRLRTILENNSVIERILRRTPSLQMPNWYLGAGCIAQTVWNSLHGFRLTQNIQDYDLAYFDSTDLSEATEERTIRKAQSVLSDLGVAIDVKNEARVHLWYTKHFGNGIRPYLSIEDAIASWPTTATSIGVRYEEDGNFTVYAPFGLGDLLSMIVRPNRKQVEYFLTRDESTSREVYNQKVQKWVNAWPKLVVVPWDS